MMERRENKCVEPHLHEVLVNHVVTLCSDGSHASFCADVAHVSSVETLEEPWELGSREMVANMLR